jgi:solute carrier family 25 phosphate transporter 23/24/25/41
LDVAKLKLMLCHKDAGTGIIDVLRKTVQSEGVKGLFRGNGLNCCRVAPGKAIELCAYETIKALTGRSDLAGGAAGALNTVATYPLEVLRTRVALNPAAGKGGLVRSLKRIARKEGKSTFYRGCAFSVAGVIPYTAAQYLVYDALCKGFCKMTNRAEVPTLATAVFGSVAVMAASAFTFPLEVYRRQLQLAGGTNAVALTAMKAMVRQHGPIGLYRGLGASCLKMAPASGVYFMCYEMAKTALHIGMPINPEAVRKEVVVADFPEDDFALEGQLEPQVV